MKKELIRLSQVKRKQLDDLIDIILQKDDYETLVSKKWRVKDLMAHIYWHEKEMENVIKTMSLKGSEYWLLETAERNEKIFGDHFDIPNEEILRDYEKSFDLLMEKVKQLPENAMNDATLFADMPPDWQPWKVFAGNMFKHYDEHITQLKNRFDYVSEN